jgi:nucleoside-diphosphate-sugar epimerase
VKTAALINEVRPTHLLHLAWYAEHGAFWHSTENFRWVEASLGLMRAFRASGGQRAVMAGTCAEYDWSAGLCREAETPTRPATPYGVCKNALREMLASYADETGMSAAWGRVFLLYGPHEDPRRLVPSVIRSLLKGEPARCTQGTQVRDFLHVRDVASAFAALLESPVEGPVNIASGEAVAVKDVVRAIGRLMGRDALIELGALPERPGDPPVLLADARLLREEIGWRPRIGLEAGLRETIEFWEARGSDR